MSFWDPATIWAALGIALIGLEVILPSFVVLFFGIGALLVAAALKLDLIDAQWEQLVVFVIGSVASLLLVRPWLLRRMGSRADKTNYQDFAGQQAQARSDITSMSGTVLFRGSPWQARVEEDIEAITAGSIVEIVRTEGTMLIVKIKN